MNIIKKLSILTLVLAAACQPATSTAPVTVLSGPASDDSETLDLTKLPAGFPVIEQLVLSSKPNQCGLSKLSLIEGAKPTPGSQYVFTYQGTDEATDEPLYQVGITGVVRTVKQSGSADRGAKTIRYFKTVDTPVVEIMVEIEPGEDASGVTGTVGRIKAWDGDIPLMCGYNRISVAGDCDL